MLLRAVPSAASRLIVLERAKFPRDKICAGAIAARGERVLRELDAVPDVPSAWIHGISLRSAGKEAAVELTAPIGRVVRRLEYDAALVEIARQRGVKIVEDTQVVGISPLEEGAQVETTRGVLRAAVVVGADGVGSVVRKAIGCDGAGSLRAQVVEVDTEPTSSDRKASLLHFDLNDTTLAGYTWDFPTIVDGQRLMCRGVYQVRGAGDTTDVGTRLDARLEALGLDPTQYKRKRYAELGFARRAKIAKDAVLLVGEAAGIDPGTGEGIAPSLRYGAIAGRFIAEVLDGKARVSDWPRALARSGLGKDLLLRSTVTRAYHAGGRSSIDRFLTRSPRALRAGCQYFGNQPIPRTQLLRLVFGAVAQTAWHYVSFANSRPSTSPM